VGNEGQIKEVASNLRSFSFILNKSINYDCLTEFPNFAFRYSPEVTSCTEGCSDSTKGSSDGTDSVTICIGNTERSIAQSKLQALLVQLEKGVDFGASGAPTKRR
jgi:hypothetical protein